MTLTIERLIAQKARAVQTLGAGKVPMSTSERIAVGLVLNVDVSLFSGGYGTVLECVHRLGAEWLGAALRVQRNGISHYSLEDES